ncbi:MAG: UDP-4-amino-4,6-dideoxy-N-acetyl-beta-L-altrosamine transaminase, partial [Planctomycetota bacterium]
MLPYGKQTIGQDDIDSVLEVLQSQWLTTGPAVEQFENALADYTQAQGAVAVNSGTAALHTAMQAVGIGPGDEVIVPAITFVATANAAVYLGAKPVFADVDPGTLLIDPIDVARKVSPRTKAIVGMDYAGQPCDYRELKKLADLNQSWLIADGCHSLGGSYLQQKVGTLADLTCFSFHPVKPITCGEGGAVVTDHEDLIPRMKSFRSHGITSDFRQREKSSQHQYEMRSLGFNYRITDLQCALGISQLSKLDRFTKRRNDIARYYDQLFQTQKTITPLTTHPSVCHARHLYVVNWNRKLAGTDRNFAFAQLRDRGIGVNVHYQPVYQHPWYIAQFGDQTGCCPVAEKVYQDILSLPIFPQMTEADIRFVVNTIF